MRYVLCRSVLRMAERYERKPERIAQRILPEGQKPVKGKPCDIEKEPGAYKRQAQKGFALPDTARFV